MVIFHFPGSNARFSMETAKAPLQASSSFGKNSPNRARTFDLVPDMAQLVITRATTKLVDVSGLVGAQLITGVPMVPTQTNWPRLLSLELSPDPLLPSSIASPGIEAGVADFRVDNRIGRICFLATVHAVSRVQMSHLTRYSNSARKSFTRHPDQFAALGIGPRLARRVRPCSAHVAPFRNARRGRRSSPKSER